MIGRIDLRDVVRIDVVRIAVPFSIFIGIYGQGLASVAGFAVCALGVWYQFTHGQRIRKEMLAR
jgi:hypothetical protein